MDDVEEAHDGGAVVGDGGDALVVVDELVHPAGAERGPHRVRHRRAGADVAQHLPAALRRVRPLLEEDDLRLHHRRHGWRLRGGGVGFGARWGDLGRPLVFFLPVLVAIAGVWPGKGRPGCMDRARAGMLFFQIFFFCTYGFGWSSRSTLQLRD